MSLHELLCVSACTQRGCFSLRAVSAGFLLEGRAQVEDQADPGVKAAPEQMGLARSGRPAKERLGHIGLQVSRRSIKGTSQQTAGNSWDLQV